MMREDHVRDRSIPTEGGRCQRTEALTISGNADRIAPVGSRQRMKSNLVNALEGHN